MTPVFSSPSNHKYDTVDYFHVDRMFGSDEDLKTLVEEAHARGIRIVLDAVFNHCSMHCAEFQDVLEKGRASRYFDWFLIRGEKPDPEEGNYECFAACRYMPKWNTSNEEVQNFLIVSDPRREARPRRGQLRMLCRLPLYAQVEHEQRGSAELPHPLHWMRECRIDGWRLDVADEVSHDFWRRFRKAVKAENEDAILIGESWHDAAPWLRGDEFDGIMNYSFTKACIDFFANRTRTAASFTARLNELLMRNTDQANEMMLDLLDSHDTERFLTLTGGESDALILALSVLFFFPGMPCICYGTEIGMEGEYEPDSRRTFDWDETHWDKTIFSAVRSLTALRPKISGRARIYAQGELVVIEREKLTLAVNATAQPLTFEGQNCYHIIGARSYLILDREETV